MMCSDNIFAKSLVSWDVESFLPFDFAQWGQLFPSFFVSGYCFLDYSVDHLLFHHCCFDSFDENFVLPFYTDLHVSKPFWFKHCDVFVIILPLLMVRSPREEVCFNVCFARFMMESKIVLL